MRELGCVESGRLLQVVRSVALLVCVLYDYDEMIPDIFTFCPGDLIPMCNEIVWWALAIFDFEIDEMLD